MKITYELVYKVLDDLMTSIASNTKVDFAELNEVCMFFSNKKGKIIYENKKKK